MNDLMVHGAEAKTTARDTQIGDLVLAECGSHGTCTVRMRVVTTDRHPAEPAVFVFVDLTDGKYHTYGGAEVVGNILKPGQQVTMTVRSMGEVHEQHL